MEKLELKHIAPYLPYGLKILRPDGRTVLKVSRLVGNLYIFNINGLETFGSVASNTNKPILRPLSDLTKEIEHNGERFVPAHEWDLIPFHGHSGWANDLTVDGDTTSWEITGIINYSEQFFKYHFDVFGLIDNGLAVDMNSITP